MTERLTETIIGERNTEYEKKEEVRKELASYVYEEPVTTRIADSGTIFEWAPPEPIEPTTIESIIPKLPITSSFRWLNEYEKKKKKLLR